MKKLKKIYIVIFILFIRLLVFLLQEWKDLGVEQLKLQTVDYIGTPTQENISKAVDFIMKYRRRKESVYVHCKAGRTRSTTIVACYLIHVSIQSSEPVVIKLTIFIVVLQNCRIRIF